MLTITDMLQTELPDGTAVLAGVENLGREVSWAIALRARAPGLGSLRGREIALLSTGILRALDASLTLTRAVEQLHPLVSAIAVLGPVDKTAQKRAEDLGQPLLHLPDGTDLEALERDLQRAVLDWRQEANTRARELEREFSNLALSGEGFDVLVQTLARRTGKPVVLQAPDIEPIVKATRYGGPDAATVRATLELTDTRVHTWLREAGGKADEQDFGRFPAPELTLDRYVVPVRDGRGPVGALSIIAPPPTLNESDRHALTAAAHACAIELARQGALRSALDAAEGDVFESILNPGVDDEATVLSKVKRAGTDLSQPHVAIAVRPSKDEELAGLQDTVERALNAQDVQGLVRKSGDHVIALLMLETDQANDRQTRALTERVAARLGNPDDEDRTMHFGVGLVVNSVGGARSSIAQAEQALALGSQVSENTITAYADLGLFHLLLATAREPVLRAELESFYQATLGKLLTYDRERGSDLVPTLEAFLATLGAPLATAERLHVHRNTLLYRLSRIEAVAGVDLRDPEARLMLHLALRIGQAQRLAQPLAATA